MGGNLKEVWLCCWNPSILTLFKGKMHSNIIATLFKTLNSEIEYFFDPINLYHAEHTFRVSQTWKPPPPPTPRRVRLSIFKLLRKPFSIYRGEETMQLLMTTYCQDIMTNFSCVLDRSTVYPFFLVVFWNMPKLTCQPFKVFMLKKKVHYNIVQEQY